MFVQCVLVSFWFVVYLLRFPARSAYFSQFRECGSRPLTTSISMINQSSSTDRDCCKSWKRWPSAEKILKNLHNYFVYKFPLLTCFFPTSEHIKEKTNCQTQIQMVTFSCYCLAPSVLSYLAFWQNYFHLLKLGRYTESSAVMGISLKKSCWQLHLKFSIIFYAKFDVLTLPSTPTSWMHDYVLC